jgi:hypothetical protein
MYYRGNNISLLIGLEEILRLDNMWLHML